MTYFSDLSRCHYQSGPFNADNWSVPLLAVGWLEYPNEFARGPVPLPLLPKLRELVAQARSAYQHYYFRGVMRCSFCFAIDSSTKWQVWSQENVFVPGPGIIYVAPGGIIHYIEAHSYEPPQNFVQSVMDCPDLHSVEYREALRIANAGKLPPLEPLKHYRRRCVNNSQRRT